MIKNNIDKAPAEIKNSLGEENIAKIKVTGWGSETQFFQHGILSYLLQADFAEGKKELDNKIQSALGSWRKNLEQDYKERARADNSAEQKIKRAEEKKRLQEEARRKKEQEEFDQELEDKKRAIREETKRKTLELAKRREKEMEIARKIQEEEEEKRKQDAAKKKRDEKEKHKQHPTSGYDNLYWQHTTQLNYVILHLIPA